MHKKTRSTSDESKELARLLQAQPQVKQKIEYYKGVLKANDKLHKALQKKQKRGYSLSLNLVLGIIPIIKLEFLGDVGKAELGVEIQNVENTVYNQQQYYEHWLQNSKEYSNRMDAITRECNQDFDDILNKAKQIKGNPRVVNGIANYKNPDNDQQLKNEYYLFLKQEVNNAQVGGQKFK